MRFSIIVPVFNSEEYLRRCVDSVLDQSFTDWELIAVNDGSEDRSLQILQEYASRDGRILVFSQINRGQFLARQRGIQESSGEYILFLDSDDELELNCLSLLNETVCKTAPDLILFLATVFYTGSSRLSTIGELPCQIGMVSVNTLKESLLSSDDLNSLCLKAFRGSLLREDHSEYSLQSAQRYGEDKLRLLDPVSRAKSAFYLPNKLYRYHHRAESMVNCFDLQRAGERMGNRMFSLLLEYMKRWNMDDIEHREKLAAYYIRNFLSVYYSTRKHCQGHRERIAFRRFDWNNLLDWTLFSFPAFKRLSIKEKCKLLAAFLRF